MQKKSRRRVEYSREVVDVEVVIEGKILLFFYFNKKMQIILGCFVICRKVTYIKSYWTFARRWSREWTDSLKSLFASGRDGCGSQAKVNIWQVWFDHVFYLYALRLRLDCIMYYGDVGYIKIMLHLEQLFLKEFYG